MALFEAITWGFGVGAVFAVTFTFWILNLYAKRRARGDMIQDEKVF